MSLTCKKLGRVGPLVRLVFSASSLAVIHPGHASESGAPSDAPNYRISLTDADLRMITLEVMKTHPLVASSPGVKHVDAYRGYQITADTEDSGVAPMASANLIFHPHIETAGIREAFQVSCSRLHTDRVWSCPHVELRRYVRLDSQDFEVRVKGDLPLAAVLALVEATRATALSAADEGSVAAEIATIILPCGEGYLVSWADRNHQSGVLVEAQLRTDGNPAETGDWETSLYREK